MGFIVKHPYMEDFYQELVIDEWENVRKPARELSAKYLKHTGTRITLDWALGFTLMVIFQLAFGLSRSGTFSLLDSGKAEKVRGYLASIGGKFPSESVVIKRMRLLQEECLNELMALAEEFQDGFYPAVGDHFRSAFSEVYHSSRCSITLPPECLLGGEVPSEQFPSLTVEERGMLLPYFHARMYMRAKRISGTTELVGDVKTPSFNGKGDMVFPLACKLGFFGGPPGINAFYKAFRELEAMAIDIDRLLNDTLTSAGITDLSIITVDGTNIPVDKRDGTGSIGTGSRGTFFGHKSSIACDPNCIPLHGELDTGHRSDVKMLSDTLKPVKGLAKRAGEDIWCVPLDAAYSDVSVVSEIESMGAVPIVDINPKNSSLLKDLKEKGTELRKFAKKALKVASKEVKQNLRRALNGISRQRGGNVPVGRKKSILGALTRLVGKQLLVKGLTTTELQDARRLRQDVLTIRRKIRSSGTVYEKKVGLSALPYGSIDWLLIYSIRGQNEGINGILKKRGDLIGDGQHTSWLVGREVLSNRQAMDSVGIKYVAFVKFLVTGQKDHPLRAIHNWRRNKKSFCTYLLVIICR